jgi:hypothetical protein
MAREFGGDLFDPGALTDDELYDLVVQQLREHSTLDADWIEVDVQAGRVTLSGRVGTDGEVQIAEKVVREIIGVSDFANELVVDSAHRGEMPAGTDEAAAHEAAVDDPLGDPQRQHSDTAEHLVEDLAALTYDTHDPNKAVRDGASYRPPDEPQPGGYESREDH